MDKLLVKFLNANGYFNNAIDLQLQLRSHPDFPSLKAITDTLDYFNIENIAASIPKEALEQLPQSFLALLNENEKPSIALVVRKQNKIILHSENASKKTMAYEAFKEKWTGTIVAIEAPEKQQKRSIGAGVTILILLFLFFAALQLISFQLHTFLLSLLSLAGVFLSYLIVKEEMGMHSKAVAKVCGTVNKNGNCAAVINSAGSKIFGAVTLSDLCVAFFTGLTLIYTLTGFNGLFAFAILLLSLPVVLFSLYQQAVVLKQWCALCLGIAGVLILQSGIVLFNLSAFSFSTGYFLKAAFLMIVPYAVWQYVKPILINYLKLRKTEEAFLQFKRNPELFTALLHKKQLVRANSIAENHNICFGADHPVITIYAATNPLCGFCTDAFKTYYKLLQTHADKIKINLIFNVPVEQPENKATQIAIRILERYATTPESALEALNNWFNNRDIERWQKQYGIPKNMDEHNTEILTAHRTWCTENAISYTPATIIDSYLYPKEYSTTDLMLFIDELLLGKTTANR